MSLRPDTLPDMLDVAFALLDQNVGQPLLADHRWPLWQALCGALPWLAEEPLAGVHALRVVEADYGVALLPRRTKLTLRLPFHRVRAATLLTGRHLAVSGHRLTVGEHRITPVRGAATLYADFVSTGSGDEAAFCRDIDRELERLDVRCRYICGGRRALPAGERRLAGFALALYDLAAEPGRRLMQAGLGGERRLGCGILIQHRAISGLS